MILVNVDESKKMPKPIPAPAPLHTHDFHEDLDVYAPACIFGPPCPPPQQKKNIYLSQFWALSGSF